MANVAINIALVVGCILGAVVLSAQVRRLWGNPAALILAVGMLCVVVGVGANKAPWAVVRALEVSGRHGAYEALVSLGPAPALPSLLTICGIGFAMSAALPVGYRLGGFIVFIATLALLSLLVVAWL